MIDEKELIQLQQYKIKNDNLDVPLCANYLFIKNYKMLFIAKARKSYRVCCSSACNFEPLARTTTFDILFITTDFEEAIAMFNSYIIRMLKVEPLEKAFA